MTISGAPEGERDLDVLLSSLHPTVREGEYVFVTVPGDVPAGLAPLVTVAEDEGTTLVLPRPDADAAGLAYPFVAGWITLRVHSALDAVGLTAAVATALTEAGISANVVAGYFHDHVLVGSTDTARAVDVLERLARRAAAHEDAVPADTKSWTWVLERRCPECGYDARAFPVERVAELVRASAAGWQEVLAEPAVGERPAPAVWSPLEYGCHVRDVYRVFEERLRLVLTEDDPLFANWDQDATALEERYREQDPVTVAAELAEAGEAAARRFESVPADGWGRTGRRSDGASFTVDSLARYFFHDVAHHLHDVGHPFVEG